MRERIPFYVDWLADQERKHTPIDRHCCKHRPATVGHRLRVCINCLIDEHARTDERRRRTLALAGPYEVLSEGHEVAPRSIPTRRRDQ